LLNNDVLDYKSSTAALRKPNNTDLKLGLMTALALYAWEEFLEIGELIGHGFKSPGNVKEVKD